MDTTKATHVREVPSSMKRHSYTKYLLSSGKLMTIEGTIKAGSHREAYDKILQDMSHTERRALAGVVVDPKGKPIRQEEMAEAA